MLVSDKARSYCRFIAKDYFLPNGDHNDLEQTALVGLVKAFRDYKPNQGSGFWNFADICMKRQIITEVKTATRNKHKHLNDSTSFESVPSTDGRDDHQTLGETLVDTSTHEPVDYIVAEELLERVMSIVLENLSDLERRSFICVAGMGMSYSEAAKYINADDVEPKHIDNALQRAKRKMESDPKISNIVQF